jgi:beta-xylosidase
MIISLSSGTLAASSVTTAIVSTGSISTLSSITLTVNALSTIGTNNLSLGFNLHHDYERSTWYSQSALRQMGMDINARMIRVFTHTIEPCSSWNDATNTGTFNWQNVDSFIERIFETGAQPLITVGFIDSSSIVIPPGMDLNSNTGLPYPDSFAAYCREWVRHFQQVGLPVKYYEIMNEAWYYFYPNWNWNEAKAQNFLTLYNTCYNTMHNQNNQILIGNDASLFTRFLNFWKANGGKLDFFSFHKYDSWGTSYTDEQGLDAAETKFFGQYDSLHTSITQARQLWGKNLPAIASEANFGASSQSGTDPRLQQLCGAVWTALVLKGSMENGIDYLCYFAYSSSKSWETRNKNQGYGFGMINHDNNQPWYPYYVQKMVATNLAVGDPIIRTSSSSSDISLVGWINEGKLNILIINKVNQQRTVNLQGIQGQLTYTKISNAVSWETPKVQTGNIYSTNTIDLNGYTVILLQMTSTQPPTNSPPSQPPSNSPSGSLIFGDGFESGGFGVWSGTSVTSGETARVVGSVVREGSFAGLFSSNGGGGTERAYSFESLSSVKSELYAGGSVYVAGSGARDSNDRFYFVILRAGSDPVAFAGWRVSGGVVRWNLLIRDGTGWVDGYSGSSPAVGRWYDVEVHWKSAAGGLAELFVDGELACSVSGVNTAAFGGVSQVEFGLPELYGCSSTTVYADSFAIN